MNKLSYVPLMSKFMLFIFFNFFSEASPSPVKTSPETSPMTSPRQRRDSDRYCQLCNAWFNNPGMAQQHYDGKKHKKNAARADLLEQLGKTLDMGEMKGRKSGCILKHISGANNMEYSGITEFTVISMHVKNMRWNEI